MKRLFVTLMAAMVAMFVASPAMAQATRTWVSGVGDDANPCSRTAPCKTFAGAISKTASPGEIDCLDPGGFGTLTITKSITIDCTGTFGSVLASGTIGFNINDSTSATPGTARVVLKGLSINGAGTTLGTTGVRVVSARDVVIVNSIIQNFSNAGIEVNGTTQISVTVDGSSIVNATRGVNVISTGGNGAARVYNTLITGGSTSGITVSGAGNKAEISGNTIIRTPKSLDIQAGGTISSYNDNVLSPGGDAPTIIPRG
ncbi:hypothetical protein [Sphingomonas bacterium]|uniref:hypothetical protein n=1 Tax=Sphingomonas bacterium TaxID=1895847 RepID=UPI002639D7A1|nr:hypothetical protein [Sphingomonas bacterium]MDB5679269.1 right-handed parallel beta-helix repeat-containing protein [Sphingomonas bacterium]